MQSLGELWADKHRGVEKLATHKKNIHVVALAAVFKARDTLVDEKEVVEHTVEVR